MSDILYRPADVAGMLGVTTTSVRRYCAQFASHLSDSATPATGETRMLTEEDVYLLQNAKRWLDAGMTYADVSSRLELINIPEVRSPLVANVEEESADPGAEVPEALAILRSLDANLRGLTEQVQQEGQFRSQLDRLVAWQVQQETTHTRDQQALFAQVDQLKSDVNSLKQARWPMVLAMIWFVTGAGIALVVGILLLWLN